VEYNQLDPLLRATKEFADGDKNDPSTGYSPFPGNINQLLFKADRYADILDQTRGIMPEFVNPKYSDPAKTVFKKPTRLECMMQDFPTLLSGHDVERVGYTTVAAELCFSPVKNNVEDGKALQEQGVHPGVAATGEADQYGAVRAILRSTGVQVEEAEPEIYQGITVVPGPAIVLAPDFVLCPRDYHKKFPTPEHVKISARSTLIVHGPGQVKIESLELDGALVIECMKGATDAVIRNVKISNQGWIRQAIGAGEQEPEAIQMRGYKLIKLETSNIVLRKPLVECAIL
jgi:UDP-sugar pyrophosphorylase